MQILGYLFVCGYSSAASVPRDVRTNVRYACHQRDSALPVILSPTVRCRISACHQCHLDVYTSQCSVKIIYMHCEPRAASAASIPACTATPGQGMSITADPRSATAVQSGTASQCLPHTPAVCGLLTAARRLPQTGKL